MSKPFDQEFPLLCAPLRVGKLTLRSRMCSAPMGFPDLTERGELTEGAIAFYENRARGGAAIVTVSEACVDYALGKSHGRLINLQNPGVLAGLTNCARAIRRHGALASIELNHAGMLSDFDVAEDERSRDEAAHYGPSDGVLPTGTEVRAMTGEQIREAIDRFARGAALVKRAGFDLLMLHAGHGWLLHQFLSPLTNRRRDEYGGSLENRFRLPLEVIEAVRRAVGPDFPIELRFSALETAPGGISPEDAIAFARAAQERVDILHVSAGGEPDFFVTHPSMFAASGCNVKYAAEIKKHVHIPVAAVGALNEPAELEAILAAGQADILCMARALLADPELPKKVEQNRTDEILRCLRCFTCHAERMLTQTRICAVNPQIGREYEAKLAPPPTAPKRLLIAGGGPGGMQAAVTAAGRGHSVILCEKTGELGGKLRCEENVPFKAPLGRYIGTMRRRMEKAGVEVRLNTEVTPELVRRIAPDALFIALGAEALRPPIPGIDGRNVVFATELADREGELGHRVAVVGGGLAGCECGLYLARKGHEVTVIELREAAAPDANPRHRPALLAQLRECVRVRTGLRVTEITGEGVRCAGSGGEQVFLPADSVLCAAGLRPERDTVDALRGTAPIVEVIGDCDRPGNIRSAVWRAYHAALDL